MNGHLMQSPQFVEKKQQAASSWKEWSEERKKEFAYQRGKKCRFSGS